MAALELEWREANNFTEQDINAIRSFMSLAFYNGYEQDIEDIMKVLKPATKFKKSDGYQSISRPKHWGSKKIDEFGGIFWSWLVLQYGDYGTSPRFGWIYEENSKRIFEIMQGIRNEDEG